MNASGEKQFDATPSRIAKAKREGNIARSQEFGANLAFAAAALTTIALAPSVGAAARTAVARASSGNAPLGESCALLAESLVPAAAAALSGAFGAIVQGGGLRLTGVSAKLERLNPVEGMKRILSRETLTHVVRASVAFVLATLAIVPSMRDLFGTIVSSDTPQHVASVAWSGAQHVVFAAAAVGGAFAFLEYGVARRTWLAKLKMSFDELKREIKENDGDPTARGRRKAFHRSLVRGSIARVKDASFVVVNPTHVAVALEYRPPDVPVPVVLVSAVDDAALRVRELAAEYRVPLVENVTLARALHRDAIVGEPIPHQHYVAVAEVVVTLARSGVLR